MLRVNIIGPGKVGQTLMTLFAQGNLVAVGDVSARQADSAAQAVAATGAGRAVADLSQMGDADLWFLTVPDDAIPPLAQALAATRTVPSKAVHCSGFLSSQALDPLRATGWQVASCHPVLSFADPQIAARQFPGTCCAIEGDGAAVACVTQLVTDLGAVPFAVDPERKALYHAAAVFSNNFATVLQGVAHEAWLAAGVPDAIAQRLGATLLTGTALSVARLGPAAALTGPAARGDTQVMTRQQAEVAAWHPEAGQVYQILSTLAQRLKTTGDTRP